MKINELIDSERGVFTIGPDATIGDALRELFTKKISALPVVDEGGMLVGIISERDCVREAYNNPASFKERVIADVMTKDLIIALAEDDLDYVMNIMTQNSIRHIPILSGQKLTGIISIRDVVRGMVHKVESENRYLKEYIAGKYETYQ